MSDNKTIQQLGGVGSAVSLALGSLFEWRGGVLCAGASLRRVSEVLM